MDTRLLLSNLERAGSKGEVVDTLSLQDKKKALMISAKNGLYGVVIYLLEHHTDLHYIIDSHQNNLLYILLYFYTYNRYDNTVRHDSLFQCVVKLVNAGVDVNQLNEAQNTPLVIAARKGFYEVFLYMLGHGGDIHYVDSRRNNLIHILLDMHYQLVNEDRPDLLLQCVFKLVEAGVDVNQSNENKDTPIVIAARKGCYEVFIYMLEHDGGIHYVDSRPKNLIHILLHNYEQYDNADRRDLLLQCVVKVVDAGADVNLLNEAEEAPIVVAARKGLPDVVVYLLEHDADIHYVDGYKNNLMHILLNGYRRYNKHDNTCRPDLLLQCVNKLIDAGVHVNQMNAGKDTPILIAARFRLCDVVMYLLKHGVDVHNVDSSNFSILHWVLGHMYSYVKFEEKYIQSINTLINTGLDINQPDDYGNTPLFYVGIHIAENKARGIKLKLYTEEDTHVRLQCKLINMLLEAGCNFNHQNKLRRTALMHHIKHQADIRILKLLIPHSDLSLTDNYGYSAINYCVQYYMINSTAVFRLLVDSGSEPISRKNGVEFFLDILICKNLGLFSYYIRLKLMVYGVTADGENMLHLLACVNYDYSLNKFNWLLNKELDINHRCSETNTPTMIAAFLLNSKYLELLTRHPRLEINTQNNQGHTALHLCIIGFTMFKDGLNKRRVNDVVKHYCRQIYPIYMTCIDILLGVDGIDVNIPDNGGRTSLMMAAMKNDRVLTRKLLQTGARVNKLDYSGRSALQYLNIYQSVFDLTCFKVLLSNGNFGLLNIPCIDGNTIIQTALCFPFFWEPCRVVGFIRYLVAENCCLQKLVNSSVESSYNQIDVTELSLIDRDKLRKLLYYSGAQGEEIMTTLNFDEEDKRREVGDTIHSHGREEFVNFCSNISLKALCRRFIRQNLGLGIQEKISDLDLPYKINDFLLLKDVLHPQDSNVDHIDNGCNDFDNDDYDGYDIDKDRDDDYSQYNYQYVTLKTDHELRQDFLKNERYPYGGNIFDDIGGAFAAPRDAASIVNDINNKE
ncbi:serine/threonine-protein phosphatase 6 regulatory ankyrin repeat subunit A isoform X2 [Patella vulgata]|uniref:serine/threonine-protein phosphatase 6 regulatory ankyrin repeat subunit A isoform X2 n=1 Tax=Patella vulgata TaxID=6465 RepID=UPI00217FEF8F|nr:serine/threonine-protein phosphatase 6 regulatory ankyrin repeat subunit A isoform X2 [Patella vulgata]XP_050395262.1 serine/threonine-protein phosphatase 6 regulatory ankyrin repeat subunit A isoform X2 [Patella vulgata]